MNHIFEVNFRDLSEISSGGRGGGRGGNFKFGFGNEVTHATPAMGVKFADPPLELGLKFHYPPLLCK